MSDAMDRKEEKERTMTGRNKNMVCGALLCAMMLSMTACGNEIPDLTEEESQRVGEYAAVTLLKYDANNRSRLVDPEMVIAKLEKEAAKEASQEEEKAEETGSTGTTEVTMPTAQEEITASMEDFFGLPEGVSITYARKPARLSAVTVSGFASSVISAPGFRQRSDFSRCRNRNPDFTFCHRPQINIF